MARELDDLGALVRRFAHDFNNSLTSICDYGWLLRESVDVDSKGRRYIDGIVKAVDQATQLARQLLRVGRIDRREFRPVDVHDLIAESMSLLRDALPPSIELHGESSPGLGLVMAEASQIQKVLITLGENASQTIGGNPGEVRVRLTRCLVDPALSARLDGLACGTYVRIEFRDSGELMDGSRKEGVLASGFATDRYLSDVGLDLMIVERVVRAHLGAVDVVASEGEGTTFFVYLPIFAADSSREQGGRHSANSAESGAHAETSAEGDSPAPGTDS